MAKFVVHPKKTLRDKQGQIHPAGSEVSAEKLGLQKKEFDVLVKDGSVLQEKEAKRMTEEQEAQEQPNLRGESEEGGE